MKKIILSIILILLCCNLSAQTSHSKSAYEIQESCCALIYNGLLWSVHNGLADPSDTDKYYQTHTFDAANSPGTVSALIKATYLWPTKRTLSFPMTHHQFFRSNIPSGWRLPTKDEFLQLLKSAEDIFMHLTGDYPAYFRLPHVPTGHHIFEQIQLTIPMKRTWGSMGPWETVGIKGSYLVQEGVISFEHSRPIKGDGSWCIFLEGDLISYAVSENTEFEATYDKPGYVRLVRDL